MLIELGKFYTHGESGRQIAIVGEVTSTRWGEMWVMEEASQVTGFCMTCATKSEMMDVGGWIEIGEEEWKRNFELETCYLCGEVFKQGEKFVVTEKGMVHVTCFAKATRELGPNHIQLPSVN